jgi:hypothetical protein
LICYVLRDRSYFSVCHETLVYSYAKNELSIQFARKIYLAAVKPEVSVKDKEASGSLLENSYENGLTTICILICLIMSVRWVNLNIHNSHENCLSLCNVRCLARKRFIRQCYLSGSELGQCAEGIFFPSHFGEKGPLPLCILRCLLKTLRWVKLF